MFNYKLEVLDQVLVIVEVLVLPQVSIARTNHNMSLSITLPLHLIIDSLVLCTPLYSGSLAKFILMVV